MGIENEIEELSEIEELRRERAVSARTAWIGGAGVVAGFALASAGYIGIGAATAGCATLVLPFVVMNYLSAREEHADAVEREEMGSNYHVKGFNDLW